MGGPLANATRGGCGIAEVLIMMPMHMATIADCIPLAVIANAVHPTRGVLATMIANAHLCLTVGRIASEECIATGEAPISRHPRRPMLAIAKASTPVAGSYLGERALSKSSVSWVLARDPRGKVIRPVCVGVCSLRGCVVGSDLPVLQVALTPPPTGPCKRLALMICHTQALARAQIGVQVVTDAIALV